MPKMTKQDVSGACVLVCLGYCLALSRGSGRVVTGPSRSRGSYRQGRRGVDYWPAAAFIA